MNDPRDDESPLHAATTESSVQSPRSMTVPPPKATLEERLEAAVVEPDVAVAPPARAPLIKPFEVWALEKKTDATWVRAAAVTHHWAKGRQVDEATFDEAVAGVQNVEMR